MAGTSVDVALFPIDTVKTRLQSPQGFLKAGGFRGIYNGLGAAAAGSAPGAALFFSTYETMKPLLLEWQQSSSSSGDGDATSNPAIAHMMAASLGEAAACLVRVPTEVIKAKMQTDPSHATSLKRTFQLVLSEKHGNALSSITGGLYRGYGITLFREIPFAMIQFPIYERLKSELSKQRRDNDKPIHPLESAACGSFSGAIAAACTTPLDVIKTRLMLGADKDGVLYKGASDVVTRTFEEGGWKVFFSGIQPRVMWISIGGFVFFGAYEGSKSFLTPVLG
ncbi:MAG: hypothetical protein SGARI_005684 [Bacillariaceae sp.]